tara:strand:+ start:228 stop:671 length:444 start_codon:yes stop_codon:yes gene_type:complete
MDINNIFNLFNNDGKESKDIPPSTIDMAEFEKTPTFKVGMFKKIILNQHVFQKKLINMFKTPEDDYGMEEMEDVGEYLAHHRAWSHIKDCVIEEEIWQGSLSIQHDDHLDTAIKLSISFFEDAEEYEKCALFVKIQKYLKNNLESES